MSESIITEKLINNILEWATELKHTAREFARLSSHEQAHVWNDLTGDEGRRRTFGTDGKEYFTKGLFEPDDLVEKPLKDLDDEIEKLPSDQKGALEKAMQMSKDYVSSNFRLKFLRAEKFDAHLAAERMALHFEEKLELFGEEKLAREIIQSDLDEDDMASLSSGYLQVLNGLDFGERKVIFYYKALSNIVEHDCYKHRENIIRSFWYVMNVISASEDVQKLGVVNVVYNLGGMPRSGIDYEKSRRLAKLFKAIPVRFCSFYPCIDTKFWTIVVETFSVIINRFLLMRFRIIEGDHEEVMLTLKAVGIPSEVLPVTDESKLLVDDHLKWLARLKMVEEAEALEPPSKRSRAERELKIETFDPESISNLCKNSLSCYTVG
mmetsp:Transcript_12572/g.18847  ORF Transcript_12572/g.18847 Transcript_12572/m.18847 type:complete len:379 (-) Transcript_12572:83-1219(-)